MSILFAHIYNFLSNNDPITYSSNRTMIKAYTNHFLYENQYFHLRNFFFVYKQITLKKFYMFAVATRKLRNLLKKRAEEEWNTQ